VNRCPHPSQRNHAVDGRHSGAKWTCSIHPLAQRGHVGPFEDAFDGVETAEYDVRATTEGMGIFPVAAMFVLGWPSWSYQNSSGATIGLLFEMLGNSVGSIHESGGSRSHRVM
jgi:hypothetical protein